MHPRLVFFALPATCCAIGAQQQTFLGIVKYGKIIFSSAGVHRKLEQRASLYLSSDGAVRNARRPTSAKIALGDTRSYQYCRIISTMACHRGNSDGGLRVYVRRREEDRSSNKYGKKSFYVHFLGTRNRSEPRKNLSSMLSGGVCANTRAIRAQK